MARRTHSLTWLQSSELDTDFDDGSQNGVHPLILKDGQSRNASAVGHMAQAKLDQVLEQASTLSAGEQLRLIAYLAERLRTHAPTTPVTSPQAAEMLTITERLARANYKGGALFKTAEEVDADIGAERDSWEG